MISDFNKNYISILGQKHIDYKNGKNWLKYVFLRWFIIDSFFEELKFLLQLELKESTKTHKYGSDTINSSTENDMPEWLTQ